MSKLTASQVAGRLGVSSYTVKRWYNFYEGLKNTDVKELSELIENGMPTLPEYQTVGSTNWRYWDEEDIPELERFKEWIPHTKNGIFNKYNKGE